MIDKFLDSLFDFIPRFSVLCIIYGLGVWVGYYGASRRVKQEAINNGVGFYAPTNAQFYFKNLNN
jgi:hypothetical protein